MRQHPQLYSIPRHQAARNKTFLKREAVGTSVSYSRHCKHANSIQSLCDVMLCNYRLSICFVLRGEMPVLDGCLRQVIRERTVSKEVKEMLRDNITVLIVIYVTEMWTWK